MKIGKQGPSAEELAEERRKAAEAQREGVLAQAERQSNRTGRDALKTSSAGLVIPRIN